LHAQFICRHLFRGCAETCKLIRHDVGVESFNVKRANVTTI
jgi:hypothetical protein